MYKSNLGIVVPMLSAFYFNGLNFSTEDKLCWSYIVNFGPRYITYLIALKNLGCLPYVPNNRLYNRHLYAK